MTTEEHLSEIGETLDALRARIDAIYAEMTARNARRSEMHASSSTGVPIQLVGIRSPTKGGPYMTAMIHYHQPRCMTLASRGAVYAPPPGAPTRRRRRRELVVTFAVMALLPLVALGIILGTAGWLR